MIYRVPHFNDFFTVRLAQVIVGQKGLALTGFLNVFDGYLFMMF